jgi:hypothetical protein
MLNLVPFSIDLSSDNQSWVRPRADINVLPRINGLAPVKLAVIPILRSYLRRSPAKTYRMVKQLSMNETAALNTSVWFRGRFGFPGRQIRS